MRAVELWAMKCRVNKRAGVLSRTVEDWLEELTQHGIGSRYTGYLAIREKRTRRILLS